MKRKQNPDSLVVTSVGKFWELKLVWNITESLHIFKSIHTDVRFVEKVFSNTTE